MLGDLQYVLDMFGVGWGGWGLGVGCLYRKERIPSQVVLVGYVYQGSLRGNVLLRFSSRLNTAG